MMVAELEALRCPACGGEGERRSANGWHCTACGHDARLSAHCDRCGAALERLAACGAVNYFCNACGELKSRSQADYRLG